VLHRVAYRLRRKPRGRFPAIREFNREFFEIMRVSACFWRRQEVITTQDQSSRCLRPGTAISNTLILRRDHLLAAGQKQAENAHDFEKLPVKFPDGREIAPRGLRRSR